MEIQCMPPARARALGICHTRVSKLSYCTPVRPEACVFGQCSARVQDGFETRFREHCLYVGHVTSLVQGAIGEGKSVLHPREDKHTT